VRARPAAPGRGLMPRPGRRGGDANTRGAILEAAHAEFLEQGYNAATIRAIARRAEVDPALIYHFFTDKPTLYAATLHLPVDPRRIRNEVRAAGAPGGGLRGGSRDGETQPGAGPPSAQAGGSAGATLVERFLSQWETGAGAPGQSFVTLAQATASSPEVARSVREYLFDRVWGNMPKTPDAEWRRTIVSSILLGMAWNRYVLRTEPIASASLAEVATWFGPLLDSIRAPVMTGGKSKPGPAEGR
jgi:AcrR family transcriptional regulator